jgi:hypothetical protein
MSTKYFGDFLPLPERENGKSPFIFSLTEGGPGEAIDRGHDAEIRVWTLNAEEERQ